MCLSRWVSPRAPRHCCIHQCGLRGRVGLSACTRRLYPPLRAPWGGPRKSVSGCQRDRNKLRASKRMRLQCADSRRPRLTGTKECCGTPRPVGPGMCLPGPLTDAGICGRLCLIHVSARSGWRSAGRTECGVGRASGSQILEDSTWEEGWG